MRRASVHHGVPVLPPGRPPLPRHSLVFHCCSLLEGVLARRKKDRWLVGLCALRGWSGGQRVSLGLVAGAVLIFLLATNFEALHIARFFLVHALVGGRPDPCSPCGCNVPRLHLKYCAVDLSRLVDAYTGPPTSPTAALFASQARARMNTSACTALAEGIAVAGATLAQSRQAEHAAAMAAALQAGTPTLPRPPRPAGPTTTLFHLFSRPDLAPGGDLTPWQATTIRSILATQPLDSFQIVLWSPDAAAPYPPSFPALVEEAPPNSLTYRVFDGPGEAPGTPFQGPSPLLSLQDPQAYTDSDLFRLLVLYKYGGVYVDLDVLLFRDLSPLLDWEWATEFSADGRAGAGVLFNNAIVRFKAGSPAITELCRLAIHATMPRLRSWAYGPHLLDRAYGPPLLVATGLGGEGEGEGGNSTRVEGGGGGGRTGGGGGHAFRGSGAALRGGGGEVVEGEEDSSSSSSSSLASSHLSHHGPKLFHLMPWCFFHGMWSIGDVHSPEREIGDEHVMGSAPWKESPIMRAAWGLHLHGLPRSREAAPGSIYDVKGKEANEGAASVGKHAKAVRVRFSLH